MKRTALSVMLCVTLLLFSACQQEPEQPVFSQPPDMTVTVTEGSVTQPWSKGNWNLKTRAVGTARAIVVNPRCLLRR